MSENGSRWLAVVIASREGEEVLVIASAFSVIWDSSETDSGEKGRREKEREEREWERVSFCGLRRKRM